MADQIVKMILMNLIVMHTIFLTEFRNEKSMDHHDICWGLAYVYRLIFAPNTPTDKSTWQIHLIDTRNAFIIVGFVF